MADFGKLNFAVAFVPQTAFPLDGRTYFESLETAQAAAATAVPVGSSDGVYHYGMTLGSKGHLFEQFSGEKMRKI